MPLDSRKAAHIIAATIKSFANRQRTVIFVYNTAGSYSYVATSVIMRPTDVVDPQIPDEAGGQPRLVTDMTVIAPLGTNFTGVVFIADTTTATSGAVAAAQKYEVIEAMNVGIVPGGTHMRAFLRRLR